jgi:hypothetical protein
MGFLGGFYLFILTRGWVVARATQPKIRLGRVAISQNPTQTRGLTSLNLTIAYTITKAINIYWCLRSVKHTSPNSPAHNPAL